MTTIIASQNGWSYEQTLPYISSAASSSRKATVTPPVYRGIGDHQTDRVLTSLIDNGNGSYSATDASLKDLLGVARFVNGHGNLCDGASDNVVNQTVIIKNQIASCWFPASLKATVVTSIELNQNDFSIAVTTEEVVFSLCSNVNSNGSWTRETQDAFPDVSQIENLFLASHNGSINNRFQLNEKYPTSRVNYATISDGVFVASENAVLFPARHFYYFPAYVSSKKCCVPFATCAQFTQWLGDYYQNAVKQPQYYPWTGQAIPLSWAAARLIKS